MNDEITRVLFYDREPIRSFDLTAEQTYHMEMRRRLNIALHLRGIVAGMELLPVDSVANEFYVNSGMAIDAFGREVVLIDRHVLSADDFEQGGILSSGTYSVYVSYDRRPTTPPSAGYRACGIENQFTRWAEVPKVQVLSTLPTSSVPPVPSDPLSDDPAGASWPIFLGTIEVTSVANVPTISKVSTQKGTREYIGVRTQRLVAPSRRPPDPPAPAPPPDPTLFPDAALPITAEDDLRASKAMIVGQDFTVDSAKVKPPPGVPADFPGTTGNLRVENNIFLKQDLYRAVGDQWLGLGEYVKTLIPQFVVDSLKIPVAYSDTVPPTVTFTVPSKLATVSGVKVVASLAQIDWLSVSAYHDWSVKVTSTGPMQIGVSSAATLNVAQKSADITLSWNVQPASTAVAPATPSLPVQSLIVSYIVIFYP